MDAVLVADDVRRTYGDTVALDGVSLSVAEGEVFGLIGPNGAGKTTLVRALTGTTDADGTVTVLGTPPNDVDTQRVGLLPQSFTPPERLTARELVAYYAGLYEETRDPEAVLADVGLDGASDTWYENLSGGQQRRVCVATALVNDPDVLFLDEPTTGIDPAGRRALWGLIENLADGGTTVFLTSHSMDEVERLADRVGLLNEGSLAAVGSPTDLVTEYGGETRLVVRTEAGTDAVADAGFVVEADAETLTFHDVDPRDIGPAVEALERAGVEYDSLTWKQPGLEEVYLRLTGETFEGRRSQTVAAPTGGAE
ncbi:ABC transporter ATP-binding protein [Halogranum rubrum]|uniref:Multidrug ABC transporter ATPase n=1 Tax=Halogranum salarium B-1 TaxID=1210908 RepID=J3JGM6_9EURY|nr:ABC transporter ATP-binding protein [Halogranum salarium]EJN60226.1 multidrug ABC transporter ATPase [Halogranum salarium B-1]